MEGRFDGRVLFLTGSAAASRQALMGFGGATAWRFLAEGGAGVVLTDIRDAVGSQAVAEMQAAGHDAMYLPLDVTDEGAWAEAVEATLAGFGHLDYLVNIAGLQDPDSVLEVDAETWKRTMEVSTVGPFLGVRAVAPAMARQGGGAVVNLASMAAHQGSAYGSAYAFSRGGLLNFTRAEAVQLAAQGIRVNAVSPGWVHTPFTDYLHADEVQRGWRAERVPLGRWGRAEEIAAAILFLLSDDASYITGTEIVVDGGVTAGQRRPSNPRGRGSSTAKDPG